jgi:uncharacterized FAD-dependent dehydrogenase
MSKNLIRSVSHSTTSLNFCRDCVGISTRIEEIRRTFLLNLYPIGEGSGYSGGINSAVINAIRAVEAVMDK